VTNTGRRRANSLVSQKVGGFGKKSTCVKMKESSLQYRGTTQAIVHGNASFKLGGKEKRKIQKRSEKS